MPELEELIIFNGEPMADRGEGPVQPVPERPRQSPQTTRTYERINRPGGTRPGSDAAMIQTLLGGRPQNAELAGVGRSNA